MGCSIWRSAEPLPELSTRRVSDDEDYIREMSTVFKVDKEKLVKDTPLLYIFTARPDSVNVN